MNLPPVSPEEPKQTKSGLLIVLVILLVLCLCVTTLAGMGGFSIWQLQRAQNLAATAATQTMRSQETATHIANATERAGFEFIDRFNDNSNGWMTENLDDESMTAEITVANGVYNWNIDKTKKGFSWGGEKSTGQLNFNDFDIYVDAKLTKGNADAPIYGLRFKGSTASKDYSYYAFYISGEKYYEIAYFDGKSGIWTILHRCSQSDAIRANEWNSLGVSARGSHFTFTINDKTVAELDDSRSKSGQVGVFLEAYEGQSGSVSFDNFAIQSR